MNHYIIFCYKFKFRGRIFDILSYCLNIRSNNLSSNSKKITILIHKKRRLKKVIWKIRIRKNQIEPPQRLLKVKNLLTDL